MNYGEYQIPLLIAKQRFEGNTLHIDIDRYAGVAFFIGDEGKIATCKHIVEMVQEGEVLVGKNLISGEIDVIYNIKSHPQYDFAIGNFIKHQSYKCFELRDIAYLPGHDVRAFGFNNIGQENKVVNVNARMLKGYVVSNSETSDHPLANTTTELSFPSLKGFSGSPLVSEQTGKLAGMLFSNHESSIEVHSFTDVEDNGDKFAESIYRIVELGLAHSAKDLIKFIREMEEC
tara:strand:+ start:1647 stop:2339 length:693 start_codon:yes stop_codon:yes gene_type:complete